MTVQEIVELARTHGLDETAIAKIRKAQSAEEALSTAVALGLPQTVIDQMVPGEAQALGLAGSGVEDVTSAPPLTTGDTTRDPKPGEAEAGKRREDYVKLQTDVAEYASLAANPNRSAEQEERFQELSASDAAQAFLDQLGVGQDEFNYDWVYNIDGGFVQPGALDDDIALLELVPVLEEIVGVDIDENLPEAEKVGKVKELLARNPGNVLVQMAVKEFAREKNIFVPDRFEQGIFNLVDAGYTLPRATTIVNVSKEFDLDPTELASIWEGQDEQTYFGGSVAGLERDLQTGQDIRQRFTRKPLLETAAAYKAGLNLYNDSKVLAAVHANDPALARRLEADPYGLDTGELSRVLKYIGGPEGKEGDPQVGWLLNRMSGAYNVTASVDSEAVRDAVRTLADAWNMTGTEPVAGQIAGEMIADAVAQARAQLPNPFKPNLGGVSVRESVQDVAAHIKARFRNMPEYRELFGHLAPGESEEEYASRFESQSQRVLGDENTEVVRTGMRSGNINSIYQQALLTEAGDASTRFQEIVARNANIMRQLL